MHPTSLFQPLPMSMLFVEAAILAGAFTASYIAFRFLPPVASPRWLQWILAKEIRSVLFVIFIAMIARAVLLPFVGIPEPRVNDEFGHLLAADTFSHLRLSNPTPVNWQQFETFHVNMRPTYHSMYPPAQGAVLALGQFVFHQPWMGVYLCTALMCGAVCWGLQAFFSPGWALLGGLIAVFKFALFGYWMNSYWGGSVTALGGALALGAVVRLCEPAASPRSRIWLSALIAAGLVLLANSRPYEGFAFSLPLLGYLVWKLCKLPFTRREMAAMIVPGLIIGMGALGFMGVYNHATTGNALLMPYSLNHQTYWPLPFFVGQKVNPNFQAADPAFAKFFAETAEDFEYKTANSRLGIAKVQPARIFRNWAYYVGLALTFPVAIGMISCMMRPSLRIVVLAFTTISLAIAACLYNFQHYFAPATIVVYVFATEGLRYLWDTEHRGERALVMAVCFSVVVAALSRQSASAVLYTQYAYPDNRKLVTERLQQYPGRYLVLVSYDFDRHYPGAELVHNAAELTSEKIVWVRSKGLVDRNLCSAYRDRKFVAVTSNDVEISLTSSQLCE